MVEAYSLDQLKIGGMNAGNIIDLKLCNSPGNHAELYIKTEVGEIADEEILHHSKSHQVIALYADNALIFKGILNEMALEKKDDVRYAVLIVKSFSMLMDIKKKSRTFQDTAVTYGNLIRQLLSEYPGADCCLSFQDRALGKILVQYKETDWEFINRIASELYIPVGNVVNFDAIRLYFGVPEVEADCRYSITGISKREEEFKRAEELGRNESSFTDYEFYGNSCLGLFSTVRIGTDRLVIHNVCCKLKKGLLNCKYTARSAAGILVHPFYPVNLVGNALQGRIVEVKGNRVRVHLQIDDNNRLSKDAYWFPYATLSASRDGSGWYYMPEKGDNVRVQFPTKHAEDAIVISSVSGYARPQNGEDSMKDPSTKYLSNNSGQRMGMGKDGISISTRSGAAAVSLSNSGAVSVIAAGDITVLAKESITLKSEEIRIHTLEKLSLLCEQGSGLELKDDGNTQLSGGEVIIN